MANKIQEMLRVLSETIRSYCPYDTGALSQSIETYYSGNEARVIIGNDLVDYARVTNEPWQKGKNPNEGWVQRAINAAVPVVQAIFRGEITQSEIDQYVKLQNNIYRATQLTRLQEEIDKRSEI